DRKTIRERLIRPYWDRFLNIRNAFKLGATVEEVADITKVDPWFLKQIRYMVSLENRTEGQTLKGIPKEDLLELKEAGFADEQISWMLSQSNNGRVSEDEVRTRRIELGLKPSYKVVDTCAGEY